MSEPAAETIELNALEDRWLLHRDADSGLITVIRNARVLGYLRWVPEKLNYAIEAWGKDGPIGRAVVPNRQERTLVIHLIGIAAEYWDLPKE